MRHLVIFLITACIMAFFWGLAVWLVAPGEITDPYLPEPLKRPKEKHISTTTPAENTPVAPKPKEEKTSEAEGKDANETAPERQNEDNQTGQTEIHKVAPSEEREAKPAEKMDPKPEIASDAAEPRPPPPDLSDAPTRAIISAEAIEYCDYRN